MSPMENTLEMRVKMRRDERFFSTYAYNQNIIKILTLDYKLHKKYPQ